MTSFLISTTSSSPQTLVNLETGVITPTGALYSTDTTVTGTGFVRLYVQGNLTSLENIAFNQLSGDLQATVTGQINAGSYGIFFLGSTAYVNNTGQIATYNGGVSVLASGLISFLNSGTIQSSFSFGTYLGTFDGAQISAGNSGTILGVNTGVAIQGNYSSATFLNSGTIIASSGVGFRGSDTALVGPITINNTGVIQGTTYGISSTGSSTYVTNSGTILGGVNLSEGNDIYEGALGRLSGGVFGNAGADELRGGDYAEYLNGGAGNDLLVGGNGDDTLDGELDNDRLTGGTGDDSLLGRGGNDTLYGGTGDDSLNGGTESDLLYGGANDDVLLGDAGNDILLGGAGADSFDGGAGTRDRAQYTDATGGVRADLQVTAFNTGFAAGDSYGGIEDLYGSFHADTLLGDTGGNFIGGDGGADLIDGRLGNDTLAGGLGNDTMTGGAGADVFVFNTAPAGNVDTITDFIVVDDTIQLSLAVFSGLAAGPLAGTAFSVGASATTAAHRILYNNANGQLLFDADGNGAGAAVHFATLTPGLAVTAADFLVV